MVYIISDTRFNDPLAAALKGEKTEQWNERIIKNWNDTISEDDKVLIFGTFGVGLGKELKPIIERLNGMLYMCDYRANKIFKPDRWKRLGIDVVWCTNIEKKCEGGDTILIPVSQMNMEDPNIVRETAVPKGFIWDRKKYKYLCLSEKYGMEEVFKGDCLNISPKFWDYTPLALDDIPQIIENMKVFESMEVEE